jgi:hypothetical protein
MSTPSIPDLEDFFQRDLVAHGNYAAQAAPAGADLTKWGVVLAARVTKLSDAVFELRLVEGPGSFASPRSVREIGEDMVRRAVHAVPAAFGLSFPIRIDPAPNFPVEWLEAIADEARAFLMDQDHMVWIIGETDPNRWAVIVDPVPVLVAPGIIDIVWNEGPGYPRLSPDERADRLLGGVVARIKARLPQLANYRFRMIYADSA